MRPGPSGAQHPVRPARRNRRRARRRNPTTGRTPARRRRPGCAQRGKTGVELIGEGNRPRSPSETAPVRSLGCPWMDPLNVYYVGRPVSTLQQTDIGLARSILAQGATGVRIATLVGQRDGRRSRPTTARHSLPNWKWGSISDSTVNPSPWKWGSISDRTVNPSPRLEHARVHDTGEPTKPRRRGFQSGYWRRGQIAPRTGGLVMQRPPRTRLIFSRPRLPCDTDPRPGDRWRLRGMTNATCKRRPRSGFSGMPFS